MVKRIRKRIPKKEAPAEEQVAEGAVEAEEEEAGIKPELAALAEDEFTARTASAFQWVIDHRLLVGGALAAVLIATFAVYFVRRQTAAGIAEASASFMEATKRYEKALGEGAPPMIPGAGEAPKEPKERRAQLEQAQEAFASTRSTYSDRAVAGLATLGLAGTHLDLDQAPKALELYDAFLARSDIEPFARAVALEGRAAALETAGKQAEAIEAWKALGALDQKAFGLLSGMQVGRLLEAQGKAGEARTLYQSLQKEHAEALEQLPNRATRAELERRLALLTGAT